MSASPPERTNLVAILIAMIRLIRIRHWLKNGLVLLPPFFAGQLLQTPPLKVLLAFLIFSLLASAVYVLNDVCDVKKDRQHPEKSKRPLASGLVPLPAGIGLCLGLAAGTLILDGIFAPGEFPGKTALLLLLYLMVNVGYSLGLKNVPVLDVSILASGFLIRVLYGGVFFGIAVSPWLYLTIMAIAFYMGLGKRFNEKVNVGDDGSTRGVLRQYSLAFLENNIYLSASLGIVFYALWSTVVKDNSRIMATIPFVVVAFFRYSFILEKKRCEDPVLIILEDKFLLALGLIVGAFIFFELYGGVWYGRL